MTRSLLGGRAASEPGETPAARPPADGSAWWRWPVLWWLVLYLVTTTRWGSYLSAPGVPVYVSDVGLLAAVVLGVVTLTRAPGGLAAAWATVGRAPVALQLAAAFLGWTALRAVLGTGTLLADPLVGLRDLAPYAYAVAALVALLVPVRSGRHTRLLVYGLLAFHAVWVLLAPKLPGYPWGVVLGGTIPVFTARPDVDSAIAGIAIALLLHDVLLRGLRPSPRVAVAALAFLAANGAVIGDLQTRAGLLATVVAVGAVLGVWAGRAGARVSPAQRAAVVAAALVALGVVLAVSPPGHRLVQAVRGQQSQALGTVEVRQQAWAGVVEYVTADARRTAMGVGFGPDFVQDSGRAYLLEGTEYTDVRSPHNYLLGTLARLGVLGAVLVLMTILAGFLLAVRRLGDDDVPTVLAGLLALCLPVTALLGVVLESPFGAIPYFWAIGHLAYRHLAHRDAVDPVRGQSNADREPQAA